MEGGLKVDTQALTRGWLNAQAPVASVADGRTTVTVTQTADRAILNWETFNVGRNTTVDFRQQVEWAVLNRINDPAGRPSQIQGQVKGQGTVLLVNRNGVVFDGGSQVNVRNLVAAAGRISDEQSASAACMARRARPPRSPTRWVRSTCGPARASTRTRRPA
ncbi:filamentous hemagglutinin N-terminal domain-containing protein [Achromobacter insuavis]